MGWNTIHTPTQNSSKIKVAQGTNAFKVLAEALGIDSAMSANAKRVAITVLVSVSEYQLVTNPARVRLQAGPET